MARRAKNVSVYERINEKELKIKETEELLSKLNDELEKLFEERDNLEMHQLFTLVKENGLSFSEATKLLNSGVVEDKSGQDRSSQDVKSKYANKQIIQ